MSYWEKAAELSSKIRRQGPTREVVWELVEWLAELPPPADDRRNLYNRIYSTYHPLCALQAHLPKRSHIRRLSAVLYDLLKTYCNRWRMGQGEDILEVVNEEWVVARVSLIKALREAFDV